MNNATRIVFVDYKKYGYLALEHLGEKLPISVYYSRAGFYLGTISSNDIEPGTRESVEYWPTSDLAQMALESGNWQQRLQP